MGTRSRHRTGRRCRRAPLRAGTRLRLRDGSAYAAAGWSIPERRRTRYFIRDDRARPATEPLRQLRITERDRRPAADRRVRFRVVDLRDPAHTGRVAGSDAARTAARTQTWRS